MNRVPDIGHELARKSFHLLTLVYLAVFRQLGYPRAAEWMAVWTISVGSVEFARLRSPTFNRFVAAPFSRIMRAEEQRRMSGMYYTAVGGFFTMAVFGRRPLVVAAGLACLAIGDAAAAVAGKLWGRRRLPWGDKSVEGSAACLAACFAGSVAVGVPWLPAAAAAAAAAAAEAAPLPFDDNLWIPVAGAAAAWLVC